MNAKNVDDFIGLLLGVAFVAIAVRGYVRGAFGPSATRKDAPIRFWWSLAGLAAPGALLVGFAVLLLAHPEDTTRRIITGVAYIVGGVAFAGRAIVGCFTGHLHAGEVYREGSPLQFWSLVIADAAVGGMGIWLGVVRLPGS